MALHKLIYTQQVGRAYVWRTVKWLFCKRPETLSVGSSLGEMYAVGRLSIETGSNRSLFPPEVGEHRVQLTHQGVRTQHRTENFCPHTDDHVQSWTRAPLWFITEADVRRSPILCSTWLTTGRISICSLSFQNPDCQLTGLAVWD